MNKLTTVDEKEYTFKPGKPIVTINLSELSAKKGSEILLDIQGNVEVIIIPTERILASKPDEEGE